MGKDKYKYRFKTLEEFKTEYGRVWRSTVKEYFVDEMDHLLGKFINDDNITYGDVNECFNNNTRFTHNDHTGQYSISSDMIKRIRNIPIYTKKELKY